MYQEEIQVVCSQVLQSLVKGAFDIFGVVLCVPKLACDEDVFAIDAALSDALSHSRLVAVDGRSVYMAVASLQGRLDGLDNLIVGCLPCAKAHSGDLGPGVESKMCRKGHGDRVDVGWLQLGI